MKCTSKSIYPFLAVILSISFFLSGCGTEEELVVTAYERETYQARLHTVDLYASDLCVSNDTVLLDDFQPQTSFHATALMDIDHHEVLLAQDIHTRLHPASTTKILTLYLGLKYGNLEDVVTISNRAVSVPSDSSIAGFSEGDQVRFEDLLYSLMLPSGNDSAVAVAEYISGDVESFVALMNQEAQSIGATNTHFVNPHGYTDDAHYTTAYDLYLMFQQALTNEMFQTIVSTAEHQATVLTADGISKTMNWTQSNQFVNGMVDTPEGVTIIGGKTGTTSEAGACLVLYCEDSATAQGYISILMGAYSRPVLYEQMAMLLSTIPN